MAQDFFADVFGPFDDVIDAIVSKITDVVDDAIGGAERTIARLIDTATDPIDAALDSVDFGLDIVTLKITDALDATLDAILEPIEFVTAKVGGVADIILDSVDDATDAIERIVVGAAEALLDGVETTVSSLFTKAGELASLAIDSLTDGLANFAASFTEGASALVEGTTNALFGFIPALAEFMAPDATKRLIGVIEEFENTPGIPPEIKAITAPGNPGIVGAGAIVLALGIYPAVAALVNAGLSPYMELVRQRVLAKARPTLLTPGDAIRARRRGFVSEDRATDQMARAGFGPENQLALTRMDEAQLSVAEVVGIWLRDGMNDDDLAKQFARLGFPDFEIEVLKELAFPIPSINDIVRMAVREVFSPEIAERFGQFDEIPDEYLLWARRSGLTEFWARNIWAAHWVLPSVQSGFEMVHRGVITEDELGALFIAQDIMPFWRDKLLAISFNPLTRVDIRRMHATSILTEDEVFGAYLDVGYSQQNAQRLTDFTVALTEAGKREPAAKERDLTKTEVLGLFRDGLLDAPAARSSLLALGFDDEEATLLLSREMLRLLVAKRKRDKELIFDRFRGGALTFDGAQAALLEMELTDAEQASALADLVILRERRNALPSKTDLGGFLKSELITEAQYGDSMALLGFSDDWVAVFLADIRGVSGAVAETPETEEEE